MKCNYILGLDEADMKKIRGFRLRLVNLFFPSLIEVLKETASNKADYQRKWLNKTDYAKELRDRVLCMAKENDRIRNDCNSALQSEQAKNERLKKEIKALHKTIGKLKGQNSNKPKHNEVERSSEVSSNER